jgi:hypothetical protein
MTVTQSSDCSTEHRDPLDRVLRSMQPPVLVVSSIAGKGIYSVGAALKERFPDAWPVYHLPIEDMLPASALREDYLRYRFIANNLPWALWLVYRIPLFYYRKLFRERYLHATDLIALQEKIKALKVKTVICASHRPAFWLSHLKYHKRMNFVLWGLLAEFGRSLGWKYIFWEVMDGYLSPVERATFDFPFPQQMKFEEIELPCQNNYYALKGTPGDAHKVLFVAGHWGQVFFRRARAIIQGLLKGNPRLEIQVVCGQNDRLQKRLALYFQHQRRVRVYGDVGSLFNLLKECGSIITKPGISTLLEAYAAGRQIFLLKGMPVAEDNNARYAMRFFCASWFSPRRFKKWHQNVS